MWKLKESVLFFIILIVSSTLAQNEGDPCISRTTTSLGICKNVATCDSAIASYIKGISLQICSYAGSAPIVCCVESAQPPAPSPPPRPISRYPTTITVNNWINEKPDCPPLKDHAVKVAETGQKSWDYCISLANILFRCISPSLNGPKDRDDLCSHNVESLIISGQNASENEFPHMALLGYGDAPEKATWDCGGSLISERWVLTAAHCYRNMFTRSNVKFVRLGTLARSDPLDRSLLFGVAQFIQHPDRLDKPRLQYNDIGLLKLSRDVYFELSVIPACLHVGPANITNATVSGWGFVDRLKTSSNILQKVTLEEFSHYECSLAHPRNIKLPRGIINETQICYGSKNDMKDACEGDSGGPIQILNDKNVHCTYAIVGIVSLGKDCGHPGIPGVYTRVEPYIPWIESIVWP